MKQDLHRNKGKGLRHSTMLLVSVCSNLSMHSDDQGLLIFLALPPIPSTGIHAQFSGQHWPQEV